MFTASPARPGEARRVMGPVRFPIAILHCPTGPIRKAESTASAVRRIPKTMRDARTELPENLRIPEHLTAQQQEQLKTVLHKHVHSFADKITELGRCTVGTHRIDTGDAAPVKQKPYRLALKETKFVSESVKELLECGIIERSESAWASPVVVVDKKEKGEMRMCVDQRAVNEVTKGDAYPMPGIEDLLDRLGKANYYSTLDAKAGFWQVRCILPCRHYERRRCVVR